MMNKCNYDIPWCGKCDQPRLYDEQGVELAGCAEHWDKKCVICEKSATRGCDNTSGLVCGTPLCDNIGCASKHRVAHLLEHYPNTGSDEIFTQLRYEVSTQMLNEFLDNLETKLDKLELLSWAETRNCSNYKFYLKHFEDDQQRIDLSLIHI